MCSPSTIFIADEILQEKKTSGERDGTFLGVFIYRNPTQ